MNLEFLNANNLLSVAALSLLLFVTLSVAYLSFIESKDRRRRDK